MNRAALVLELALHVALVVFLAVAAYKFLRMLEALDIGWAKGLPVGLVFIAAAVFVGHRAFRRVRCFWRGEGDGISQRERR